MKKLKVAICLILVTMVLPLYSGCVARLPVPEIKEGRFNISVTYEIDGEIKTYTGVYVCEFDGIHVSVYGAGRDWEGELVGEEERDIAIQTNVDGVIYINLGLNPEYFMNDPDAILYDEPKPNLFMIYHDDDPDFISVTDEEDVIASYGVRLISYDYDPPIENTFKEKFKIGRPDLSIN